MHETRVTKPDVGLRVATVGVCEVTLACLQVLSLYARTGRYLYQRNGLTNGQSFVLKAKRGCQEISCRIECRSINMRR